MELRGFGDWLVRRVCSDELRNGGNCDPTCSLEIQTLLVNVFPEDSKKTIVPRYI